jgi:hypothetical protein
LNRPVLLQTIWFAVAGVYLAVFAAGIRPRFEELRLPCAREVCPALALRPEEFALLGEMGLSAQFYAAYQVAFEAGMALLLAGLAWLVFRRKGNERIGLLVSLALVMSGAAIYPNSAAALGRVYPPLVPLNNGLFALAAAAYLLFIYLFPDGRFSPRWLRHLPAVLVPWIAAVVILQSISYQQEALTGTNAFTNYSLLGLFLAGILAQVYRYRRDSTPVQRQQTRWVVIGLLGTLAGGLIWLYLSELTGLPPGRERLSVLFPGMAAAWGLAALLPISIVFSILRYRLWNIDVIIRRTVIYSLLVVSLVGVYGGSVALIQRLFASVSGQRSALAVVISTLAIAALFNPLRKRIQAFIDRRFYRRRYNAERTLQAFSETLRGEVNLDSLSDHLVSAVEEALQPQRVSLWIREPGGRGKVRPGGN